MRESPATPGWSGQLLMFSGTIFFISLAIYFGIVFGYRQYLETQVAALDEQIKSYSRQITSEEQDKLISFYSQLANLNAILKNHVVSSRIFTWLEKNTGTNIYYSKFGFLIGTYQINLSGSVKTVDDFSKQLVVFQNDPAVERVSVNSFASNAALWQFDISIFLNRNVLDSEVAKQQ